MKYLAGTGLFLAIVAALYSTREVLSQNTYKGISDQIDATAKSKKASKNV